MRQTRAQSNASFEKLYAELESVIAELENGNLSLDDSCALFERGMALAKRCGQLLDAAELRIKELLPGSAGETILVDFEADE